MAQISFKPKTITKKLLSVLNERGQDVLNKRFGLNGEKKMTLEAIGNIYGITRERVRQIENFALNSIRKSDVYEEEKPVFDEIENNIRSFGGVVSEKDILEYMSKNEDVHNYLIFLLVLGDPFEHKKEDVHFNPHWVVDRQIADSVRTALQTLFKSLSLEDLISEEDIINRFLEKLKDVAEEYRNKEIARRWLGISKKVDKNVLGDWGIAHSPNIKARGMRDYAFLVIRKNGSPMHFSEVAKEIEKTFNRKAHVATCHNDLIRDDRFVLVGRGLYALSDWGYASGVVRDVIIDVLKKESPLSKKEIIERVMRERYVKPNTILVNLQNPKFFKRDEDGKYYLA